MTAIEFMRRIGDNYNADVLANAKATPQRRACAMTAARRQYSAYQTAYATTSLYELVRLATSFRFEQPGTLAAARDRDAGRECVRVEELES